MIQHLSEHKILIYGLQWDYLLLQFLLLLFWSLSFQKYMIKTLQNRSTDEIIYDELDTSTDVGYDKISIGFSLDADN